MPNYRIIAALPLLLASLFGMVLSTQTQTESSEKSCVEYKSADAEMNRIYQQVLNEYKADTVFTNKFRVAQRAWLVFRDAQVGAQYPALNPGPAYGSVYPMCRCEALADLTNQRTEQLREWVRGREEGDVCSGSIKIRH